MKQAIIVHGTCSKNEYYNPDYPTLSNSHWLPWLGKQLAINDIPTVAIEMPWAFDERVQVYEDWRRELERYDIDEESILIGHSFGTGFLLRWLAENSQRKISQLVLVAPWLDPEHIHQDFFDFEITPTIAKQVDKVVMFSSTDDDVLGSTATISDKLSGIQHYQFTDKGHFTFSSLGTEEFPELLEAILDANNQTIASTESN